MAVHVIRRQPNYINAGLFNTAFGVLGDQINGMLKRSQDAADAKGLQKSIGLFSDAMRPKKGLDAPAWEPVGEPPFSAAFNKYLNDNMVSKNVSENIWNTSPGLGKDVVGDVNDFTHALSQINPKHIPYVAELGHKLYGDRLTNQEKERYGASTRDTLLANGGLDRNNPNLSFANLAQLAAQGVDVSDALKSFYAPMQGNVVDTGTKKNLVTFNTVNGDHTQGASMDVEVSPDVAHEAASKERVAKTNAGATRAASRPKHIMIQGEDGEVYSYEEATGRTYKNGIPVDGVRVAPRGGDEQVKNARAYLEWAIKTYKYASTMPPDVQAQVQQAQKVVSDSFMGGGQNPVPQPVPAPAEQGGYGGYSEDNIQAAMKRFGMTREQVIAQINMEMAQGGY